MSHDPLRIHQNAQAITPEEVERQQRLIRGEGPLATGGPIPPPLTVADLTAKHIGKKVRVTAGANVFAGRIDDFRVILDETFGGNRAASVEARFPGAVINYPLVATVEVLT